MALDIAKQPFPYRAAFGVLLQTGRTLAAAVLYLDCVENAPELNVEVVEIVSRSLGYWAHLESDLLSPNPVAFDAIAKVFKDLLKKGQITVSMRAAASAILQAHVRAWCADSWARPDNDAAVFQAAGAL